MGRPGAALLNFFLIFGGWGNMVKHALVCYADRRSGQYVGQVTKAIDNPSWARQLHQPSLPSGSSRQALPEPIDDPYVGAKSTIFKRK